MKKLNKKGFTIVELVIVIAVIAILAAVLIPTFGNVIKKANESAVMQEAAACYKEVMALDLADGARDGSLTIDGTPTTLTGAEDSKIAGYGGKITYSASDSAFSFKYETTKYTVEYKNGDAQFTVKPVGAGG